MTYSLPNAFLTPFSIASRIISDTGRHALQQGAIVLETKACRKIEARTSWLSVKK